MKAIDVILAKLALASAKAAYELAAETTESNKFNSPKNTSPSNCH